MTIRFPWKRLYAPRESRSLAAGGTRQYDDQLRDLIAEYRNESQRWTGSDADDLWDDAWQLEAVRDGLLRGHIDGEYARNWIIAGRRVLSGYQNERSRSNHPAGKLRNDVE